MALQPFKYIAADSLATAATLLREHQKKAAVMAGGTDLLGTLKDAIHPTYPELLISLKPLKGLRYVKVDPNGVRIGALTTLDEIAQHPAIRETYPLLAEAARSVASPQIRKVATIAGNICQEPRCWYYRNPENAFNCLRKGGKKCNALWGENRFHSVFGGMCVSAPPCAVGCPARVNIPAYMTMIRSGDLAGAAQLLLQCNPLPAITGRVCPHSCEADCNRADCDEPVSVRDVERFLGDYVLARAEDFYPAPEASSPKRVAIVGAGPAGLTAAYFLRKSGHSVTVVDRMPEAGGMLTYSIPAYRLPKAVVRAQVRALEGMGIRFELGAGVGSGGLTLSELAERNHGVFLAIGLWEQKSLKMEKEALLEAGLEYLIEVQRGQRKSAGQRVLVIGGGSVAVDVAITALRLGAQVVTMAFLESLETMPALPEYIEQALLEGVKLLPSYGPQRILDQDGKLTGIELVRCTSVLDEAGRFSPTFDPAVTTSVEADQVLVAIGQAADLSGVEPLLRAERGLIVSDRETHVTSMPGVFAGGDITSGPATVVDAIAAGRKAAAAIDVYLGDAKPKGALASRRPVWLVLSENALKTSERVQAPERLVAERTVAGEDRATLAQQVIEREAARCANCGCVAVNASDIAPALIALGAKVKTTQRALEAEELFAAVENKTTVLELAELIREIEIPAPQPGTKQRYLKFRLRNAIDFPIVSIAFCSTMQGTRFHKTKLVLGAVAPVPLRSLSVEELLEGKEPSEALAKEAGILAVREAQPLAQNKFKMEIVKGLLREVILSP